MSVKVHVKLRDRYGWDGGHNVAAENVLVKPTGFLIGSYRWNKGGQTGTPYDLTASWNFQVAQTFEKCE